MFMIEKSLIVVIFVMASGWCLLGAQYIFGDVFGVTMTNFSGQPLKNNLIQDLNTQAINKTTSNVLAIGNNGTSNNFLQSVQIAASIGLDLIQLMAGIYIFNIMLQLGVPAIFVGLFITIYLILLIRSIMGFIRGI